MTNPDAARAPPKLKVLIVGIDYAPNQFTRTVEKYDCETLHVNGDKNTSFPRFADCVIAISSHMSHGRYYAVKAEYKARKKPLFLVGHSFSEVKSKFENWLLNTRGWVLPAPIVRVDDIEVPVTWIDTKKTIAPENKEIEIVSNNKRVFPAYSYTDEQRQRLREVIIGGYSRGRSVQQIADDLNASGVRKADGTKWGKQDVYTRKYEYAKAAKKELGEESKRAPKEKRKPKERDFDPVLLIQRITASPLDAMDKVNLIAKVSVGEIKQDEFVSDVIVDNQLYLERVSILRPKDQNPHVTLTKEQAELILGNLKALEKFLEGDQ